MKTTSYFIFSIPVVLLLFALSCIAYIDAGREPAFSKITLGGEPSTLQIADCTPSAVALSVFEKSSRRHIVDTLCVDIRTDTSLTAPVIEAGSEFFDNIKATVSSDTLQLTFELNREKMSPEQYKRLNKICFASPVSVVLPANVAVIDARGSSARIDIAGMRSDYLECRGNFDQTFMFDNCRLGDLVLLKKGYVNDMTAWLAGTTVSNMQIAVDNKCTLNIDGDAASSVTSVAIEPLPLAEQGDSNGYGYINVGLGSLRFSSLSNRHYARVNITFDKEFRAGFSAE